MLAHVIRKNILVLILFKFKKRPKISRFRVFLFN